MRSFTILVLVVLSFIFPGNIRSEAQESSQFIALITGLKGNVYLKKPNQPKFVKTYWGTQLFKGDQIKTETGSEATLTFSNSNLINVGPNSTVTISENGKSEAVTGGNVRKVSSAMMINMTALTLKKDEKKDAGALAGLRSGNFDNNIELTFPYNTVIKTNRPAFTWTPRKSYDNFIVNLYDSNGLVWSKKVSETILKFPENVQGLVPGKAYFWNVEGEELLNNEKSPNQKFSILSADKTKEVTDQEATIRKTFINDSDSSSLHSFLGAYYFSEGLLQDAIKEFEIISKINPDAPLPHEILGSLYSDTGNKDKAIEELQKALALSKNIEK